MAEISDDEDTGFENFNSHRRHHTQASAVQNARAAAISTYARVTASLRKSQMFELEYEDYLAYDGSVRDGEDPELNFLLDAQPEEVYQQIHGRAPPPPQEIQAWLVRPSLTPGALWEDLPPPPATAPRPRQQMNLTVTFGDPLVLQAPSVAANPLPAAEAAQPLRPSIINMGPLPPPAPGQIGGAPIANPIGGNISVAAPPNEEARQNILRMLGRDDRPSSNPSGLQPCLRPPSNWAARRLSPLREGEISFEGGELSGNRERDNDDNIGQVSIRSPRRTSLERLIDSFRARSHSNSSQESVETNGGTSSNSRTAVRVRSVVRSNSSPPAFRTRSRTHTQTRSRTRTRNRNPLRSTSLPTRGDRTDNSPWRVGNRVRAVGGVYAGKRGRVVWITNKKIQIQFDTGENAYIMKYNAR